MSGQDVTARCHGRISQRMSQQALLNDHKYIYINKECHISMAALQRIHWNFSRSSSNETTCSSFKTLRNLVKIVFFRRCIAYSMSFIVTRRSHSKLSKQDVIAGCHSRMVQEPVTSRCHSRLSQKANRGHHAKMPQQHVSAE